MAANERKLTDEQREELIHLYITSRADPYATPITQKQLGEQFGISQATVSKIMLDSGAIERVRRRTKSNVLLAQAIAEQAATHIMHETIASAYKKREEKYEYITQGDRRDILDRAGVRAEKKDSQDITLSFVGTPVNPGMPAGDNGAAK